MSYDEQRISDQIDGGLVEKQRLIIKEYVEEWMQNQEDDTFTPNEHGVCLFKNGATTINIKSFFEDVLEDFIQDFSLNINP